MLLIILINLPMTVSVGEQLYDVLSTRCDRCQTCLKAINYVIAKVYFISLSTDNFSSGDGNAT